MRHVYNRYNRPATITVDELKRKYGPRSESSLSLAPSIAPAERPAYDLTLIQKCALLRLSWQHGHQVAARWLIDNHISPAPKASDFAALAALGLAEKKPNSNLHKLTVAGLQIVGEIGSDLIRHYAIHESWITSGTWIYAKVHCTCGWSASVRKGDFAQLNAMRAFSRHAANARATDDAMALLKAGLSKRQSETA